jgi:zinc transport system substrate-binding protein
MKKIIALLIGAFFSIASGATTASADQIKIVTDIAPVHSIVSQVVGNKGHVTALVSGGADPHHFALKPSQAKTVSEADVIVWMGSGISPALEHAFESLAPNAKLIDLSALQNDKKSDGHEDHAHKDEGQDHEEHAHDLGYDPHFWLNPEIVARWIHPLEDALIAFAPMHKDGIHKSAHQFEHELEELAHELKHDLEPHLPISVLVSHDAFSHFDAFAGTTTAGAITDGTNRAEGLKTLKDLEARLKETPPDCLIEDPAEPSGFAQELAKNLGIKTIPLSPIGVGLEDQQPFYQTFLKAVTSAYVACKAKP